MLTNVDPAEGGAPADGGTDASTDTSTTPTDSATDQASTDADLESGPPGNNYKAVLTTASVVTPPTNAASASGTASLTWYPGANVICGRVIYSGLTQIPPQSAHIHDGNAGATGSVVNTISTAAGGPLKVKGSLVNVDAGKLMIDGLYLDIHTNQNTQGEIRGQIVPDTRTGMEVCE